MVSETTLVNGIGEQDDTSFGPRIVSERERLKLKQVDLCIRTGVSKTTQIKYEAGQRAPDVGYLRALDAAGLDILYIITGDRSTGAQLSEQQQNLLDIWEAAPAVLRDAALAVLLSPHHPEILKRERDIPGRFAHGVLDRETPRFEFFMQLFKRFRGRPGEKPLAATRFEGASTMQNLEAILRLLQNPALGRVILFATHSEPSHGYSRNDGPDSNLPLVAALVEIKASDIPPMYVVFDGLFLTAARAPRYSEVRELLDAAVATGKAFFGGDPVPFTSSSPAEEAVATLLSSGELLPLDAATRPRYFALLSSVPESAR